MSNKTYEGIEKLRNALSLRRASPVHPFSKDEKYFSPIFLSEWEKGRVVDGHDPVPDKKVGTHHYLYLSMMLMMMMIKIMIMIMMMLMMMMTQF